MTKTIFEKIILREIPATIHHEDDDLIIIDDINPVAPIHLLIIPKKKIETLNDLNVEAKKIAIKLGIDKSGYRTIFNCNEDGGQTVYHIHLHLIGGRSLGWPPG